MKRLIAILIVLAGLALLLLLWFNHTARQDWQALHQRQAEAEQAASMLAAGENLLTETATARALIHQSIITPEILPDFINQLENLAAESGVSSDLSGGGTAAPMADSPDIELRLTARGAFGALFHFATLLDALPVALIIDRAEWRRLDTAAKSGAPLWQANFTLHLLNLTTNEKK